MPQGPTSRGCEACRAQKKKCDLTRPTCSRCQRLRIACVGCGQQRFKFSEGAVVPSSRGRLNASPHLTSTPSNKTTCLQQAVMVRLQASNDVRYHIGFRYGTFLTEIPKRLGSNAALDAAVAALLARHTETSRRQDQSDLSAPAVIEYNHALAALRITLGDPREASTSETLCAVMLLTFCQARFDDQFTFFWSPHGQGIAQLVRMRNFPSGRTLFEVCLCGTLNGTLLLQSFANPDVRLSTQEYQKLEAAFVEAASSVQDVQHWILMVRISELMMRARIAIASGSFLDAIAAEAEAFQVSMQTLLASMHGRLKALEAQPLVQARDIRMHAGCQRAYGVALATTAILLCVQRRISPRDPTLHIMSAGICNKILLLSHYARAYRPLGAIWTVHALICAWCATQDATLRAEIEDALIDYQRDAMGPKANIQMDSLRLLERRLSLLE